MRRKKSKKSNKKKNIYIYIYTKKWSVPLRKQFDVLSNISHISYSTVKYIFSCFKHTLEQL